MIRSIVFNVILFVAMTIFILCGIFFFWSSEKTVFKYWFTFSKMFNFITKYVGGITFEIENPQNIIDGRVIYAIRHESMWETIALMFLFKKPVFVLKKELRSIPIFGYLADKVYSIFVDRENGAKALIETAHKVSDVLDLGCQVIIFPEGTRLHSGEYKPLKRGIALFYKKSDCSVVPVVHNAGNFWPRHSFKKNPGTITIKFLNPIAPNLPSDQFMDKLNEIFFTELKGLEKQEK